MDFLTIILPIAQGAGVGVETEMDLMMLIAKPALGPLSDQITSLTKTVNEQAETLKEAKKEKNDIIREKMRRRALESVAKCVLGVSGEDVTDDKVQSKADDYSDMEPDEISKDAIKEITESIQKKIEAIIEDVKKKVQADLKEASEYFDQISQLSGNIPPALVGYGVAFGTLVTQAAGAVSAAIMNPGSMSFTLPSIVAATQAVQKAKSDLQATLKQFITCMTQIDKCFKFLYNIPVVGALIQTAISAVLTPISLPIIAMATVIDNLP